MHFSFTARTKWGKRGTIQFDSKTKESTQILVGLLINFDLIILFRKKKSAKKERRVTMVWITDWHWELCRINNSKEPAVQLLNTNQKLGRKSLYLPFVAIVRYFQRTLLLSSVHKVNLTCSNVGLFSISIFCYFFFNNQNSNIFKKNNEKQALKELMQKTLRFKKYWKSFRRRKRIWFLEYKKIWQLGWFILVETANSIVLHLARLFRPAFLQFAIGAKFMS